MLNQYYRILKHLHEGEKINLSPSNHVMGQHPPSAEFTNGRITTLNVSQGLIKRLLFQGNERPDICPRLIYEIYLTGNCEKEKSESMIRGLYAEYKWIGKSAYENVTDLPKNKRTGQKTVIQQRIDATVPVFRKAQKEMGMILSGKNTQVKIVKPFLDHPHEIKVFLSVTVDVISPIHYKNINYDVACIDVKLAKDIKSTFCDSKQPWVYSPWGDIAKMDKSQAYLHSVLLEFPFIYFVIDYKEEPSWNLFPVETTITHPDSVEARNRYRELMQSIKWVINKIVLWQEEGFQTEPQTKLCQNCPVLSCEEKEKIRFA